MTRRLRALSGRAARAAGAAAGVGSSWGALGASLKPAQRVVERVVETASARRWNDLAGVCTFAGSSSRNLRFSRRVVETSAVS